MVADLKRAKRENKEQRRMKEEVERLKLMLEEMKQRDTAEAVTTRTEFKWKWKDGDGALNMYRPDQSQALNALGIGQTHSFSTSEFKYTITKSADDAAQQKNDQTGTIREVKRYALCQQTVTAKSCAEFRVFPKFFWSRK